MADISVTAASVQLTTLQATRKEVTYGEAVTQGQSVYLKASDSKWWKADANGSETAGSGGVGAALTKGAADDKGLVVTEGYMNLGATLVPGQPYFVSSTAGGICPAADLSSTEYTTYLGTAISASIINLKPHASGGLTA